MYLISKVFFLWIFFSLLSFTVIAEDNSGGWTTELRKKWLEDQQRNTEQREGREDDREKQRQTEEKRREERERTREIREQTREAQDRRAEAREKAQNKCDEAHDKVQEEIEAKKEEKEKSEENFYDLEEKITDLENENSKQEVKLSEKMDELKKTSKETIQDFKDDMGDELKEIEESIKQLEESMAELKDKLEELEETRLTAFYARRKQQNEFYSRCFGQALEQTEKERSNFYRKKSTRTLKRRNMGQLIGGGKQQTKSMFSSRFNSFLHFCLNNQAALLEKQNQQNEYNLALEKLARQEKRMKEKIKAIRAQVANIKTTGKVAVLKKFKEKMEAELNTFSQSYNSLAKNHKNSAQQIIKQIKKIKQQQASVLMNRAQAVPQETRSVLISKQCNKMDTFNLFPTSPTTPPIILPTSGGSFGGTVQ